MKIKMPKGQEIEMQVLENYGRAYTTGRPVPGQDITTALSDCGYVILGLIEKVRELDRYRQVREQADLNATSTIYSRRTARPTQSQPIRKK